VIFDVKYLDVASKKNPGPIIRDIGIMHIPIGDSENCRELIRFLDRLDSYVFLPLHRIRWDQDFPLGSGTLHSFFLDPDEAAFTRLRFDGEVRNPVTQISLNSLPRLADRYELPYDLREGACIIPVS